LNNRKWVKQTAKKPPPTKMLSKLRQPRL